jgi:hypothetical protein
LTALALAVLVPALGIALSVEAAETIGLGAYDFVFFLIAGAVLGGTSVVVAVTILWRKPGNRIGLVMVAGGLLLMSVFTSWPIGIIVGSAGDHVVSGLLNWWGNAALLPAVALLFPAVGILFPDERLPGRRWRPPVAAGVIALGIGTVLQTIAPWRLEGGYTTQNPLAIDGVPVELFELGAAVAAGGTFFLFGVAVAAVVVRFRRSAGIQRAQQKWLVASLIAMAIAFPVSFGTNVGPDLLIDLLSVLTGALLPIAVGIAILRYHVFEIDRIVSRTISYAVITAILTIVFGATIVATQSVLTSITSGQTVPVAASTLAVIALFQPVRRRVQRVVDRRFDRARYDAEHTAAAFSERLRDEVDLTTVTTDLAVTTSTTLAPSKLAVWIRESAR